MMSDILLSLSRLQEWRNIVDIALVSMMIFFVLQLFRGTQAVQLLRGILVITLIIVVINQTAQLSAFKWLWVNSAAVILVAIPVIFQPELRRALERVGRTAPLLVRRDDSADMQRLINEVIIAVEQLAESAHRRAHRLRGQDGAGRVRRPWRGGGRRSDVRIADVHLLPGYCPARWRRNHRQEIE